MKRKLSLLILVLATLTLTGCSGGGGGGVDPLKILQNPWVMIIGGIIIAYWMFRHSK